MIPVARRFQCYCDAENDIGLTPYLTTDLVLARNHERLQDALNGMWHGSLSFRSVNSKIEELLYPIQFSAKEFFFPEVISTLPRLGTGVLIGAGAIPYPITGEHYGPFENALGGATTRLTRVDGENGDPFFRLCGNGFQACNIEFKGRPYLGDVTGEGPTTGTKASTCFEMEGRASPATGRLVLRDCNISDFTTGIKCLAGYYNDAGGFVADENHADNSVVDNCLFFACNTCFRSENIQALSWNFHNTKVGGYGGSGAVETIIFDIVRGGRLGATGLLEVTCPATTLFRVNHYSQNTKALSCDHLYWDRFAPQSPYYFTLFEYAGPAGDAAPAKWAVRISGDFPGNPADHDYDESQLIKIAPTTNFPFDDILVDITGMPTDDFTQVGHMWRPDNSWRP